MYALRAHQAYPNSTWLEMVETINNNNTLYWDDTCGGGVLWLTYRPLIKNTITNGYALTLVPSDEGAPSLTPSSSWPTQTLLQHPDAAVPLHGQRDAL